MKKFSLLFILSLTCFSLPASAEEIGMREFESVRQCVMQNDREYCSSIVTPQSKPLLERFLSYKLMPCLPTNFSFSSAGKSHNHLVVRATMPAPDNRMHIIRLAFINHLLDVQESLRIGLGEQWQDKLSMAEQLFLFIKQSAGGNFNCDMLPPIKK